MHDEIVYAKDINKEKLEKILTTENNIEYLENKLAEIKKEIEEYKAYGKDIKIVSKATKWMRIITPILMFVLISYPISEVALSQILYSAGWSGFMLVFLSIVSWVFKTRDKDLEETLIRDLKAVKILEQDIEKEKEKQKLLTPSKGEEYEIITVINRDIEDYNIKYNHIINYGLPTKLMEETVIEEEKGKVKSLNRK